MKRRIKIWAAGFVMIAAGLVVILTFGQHLPKWVKWYVDWAFPDKLQHYADNHYGKKDLSRIDNRGEDSFSYWRGFDSISSDKTVSAVVTMQIIVSVKKIYSKLVIEAIKFFYVDAILVALFSDKD